MLSQTLGTLGKYLIVIAIVVAGLNVLAYNGWQAREQGRLNLIAKRDAYLAAPQDYGVIYFGDSRTFCALHPDLLEEFLGVAGYNLSFWAHWLPTQYAYIEDIAPHIPDGTVFVWSLGHVNFAEGKIRSVYPVGWQRVWTMLSLGFKFGDLRENLLAYTPVLWAFGTRERIMEEIDKRLDQPLLAKASDGAQQVDPHEDVDKIVSAYAGPSGVATTELYHDGADLASVALYKNNGAYLRVEVKPDYYRGLQRQTVADLKVAGGDDQSFQVFHADPRYWGLFLKALDVLQQHGVRVVINEIEEAPHHYPSAAARNAARKFMRDVVRTEVVRRGLAYVRADFDRLQDTHYFDYNHLNSIGVAAYTGMIAPLLAPLVGAKSGD